MVEENKMYQQLQKTFRAKFGHIYDFGQIWGNSTKKPLQLQMIACSYTYASEN